MTDQIATFRSCTQIGLKSRSSSRDFLSLESVRKEGCKGTVVNEILAMNTTALICRTGLTVGLLLVLAACGSREGDSQGGAGSGVGAGTGTTQTDAPQAAPDAQPEYGPGGVQTSSQVVTNPGPVSANPASAATGTISKDQALAERVRIALSTGSTGTTGRYTEDMLADIGVTASGGAITLSGEVGSEEAKQLMGSRAQSIEGVTSVNNQLRVTPGKENPGPFPGVPAGRGKNGDVVPQNPNRGAPR